MRRGWKEGREGGSDRQQRGERQVRQGGREGERERRGAKKAGEEVHTHTLRQAGRQAGRG